jgi:hypothetical protein
MKKMKLVERRRKEGRLENGQTSQNGASARWRRVLGGGRRGRCGKRRKGGGGEGNPNTPGETTRIIRITDYEDGELHSLVPIGSRRFTGYSADAVHWEVEPMM